MVNLNDVTNVHFIGIAGAGMRAIANVFIEKGYHVSGSDLKASPVTEQFAKKGARICIGQRPENLQDAQVVVISSAIRDTNVELAEARRRGIPVIHRSDALVHIMSWGKGISVAGAHGKTTTSSMLGQVFEECHQDPTIVIGGEVDYLHSNSILGKGAYVIAEADESDGTFLKQNPYIAVVTNIDADHMDHYGSLENVIAAFKQFIQKLDPEEGLAVLCFENDKIRALAPQTGRRYVSYGIEQPADYQASDLHYLKGKLHFFSISTAKRWGIWSSTYRDATTSSTPWRRQPSPMPAACPSTEINATLTAARDMGTHRVVCLFQPHRYTRTKLLLDQYGSAFAKADKLIVTDVYSAGEDPIPGVSGELIAKKVKETTGQDVTYIPHKEDLVAYLKENSRPLDLVITMGAGDIYKVGEAYLAEAKEMEK